MSGTVIDVATRAGIPDVTLRIAETPISAATDGEGRFVLHGLRAGTWTLLVEHVAYGAHEHAIAVAEGVVVRLEVRLAPEAIELDPVVVEGETSGARGRRASGASFWEVTREEIEDALGSTAHMGDLLRRTVPGLRVRQSNSLAGNEVCLEFRAAATISLLNVRPCNHPLVYLDGIPISNPQSLYGTIPMNDLERIQVVPPGDAGARYGTGSLYGVILIETRRPGRYRAPPGMGVPGGEEGGVRPARRVAFDWSQDPAGHDTKKAWIGAFVGNALGLALGLAVATRCISVTDDDDIEGTCGSGGNVAAGSAALLLPAFGSALGVRLGGRTGLSRGRLGPAIAGAGMALFPGWAFSLATVGGSRTAANHTGRALLALGVPLAVTVADKLFRNLRGR